MVEPCRRSATHISKGGPGMKLTAVILVAAIAAALGYLLGTESGRGHKETLLVKLGRGSDGELGIESAVDIIEDAPSA
jgi:hypothetical protein